jgi:hemerythrin
MTPEPTSHPSNSKQDDHAEIESLLDRILVVAEGDVDLPGLRDLWVRFADVVEAHFQMEERLVFRRASNYDVADLQWLWRDHGELRERIEQMTAEVERRALRPDALREFRDKLRAHAELEDRTAYRWASWDRR